MTTTASRVRMTPDQRRTQLLDIGVRMLGSRPLDALTTELLAEEAGISRGLLYHYFESLHGYHVAVVARSAAELVELTAPEEGEDLVAVLNGSLGAYVDYVAANRTGYLSLVQAAAGDAEMRTIYEDARATLTDRMFARAGEQGIESLGYADSPASRMLVRAWAALAESLVLEWTGAPQTMTRGDLVGVLGGSLFSVLEASR